MSDKKEGGKFLERLKRPRGIFLALIYVAAAAAIISSVILVTLGHETALGYVAYGLFGLSAILLGYTVYTVVIYAPAIKKRATERLKKYSFTAGLVEDYIFRTAVLTFISIAVTVAFATMNFVSAIKYGLIWYAAIAGYYFILLIFRAGTLYAGNRCAKKYADDERAIALSKWKIYLVDGGLLIMLEIAMAVAVTEMMLSKKPMQGGQIMAITTAAFTFYKVIMSVRNIFKAKRYEDPVTQSIRTLNFADSFMSIASLTVLLTYTFGEGGEDASMKYLKATVCFVCCAAIIAIASYMIIKAARQIKKSRTEKGNDGR